MKLILIPNFCGTEPVAVSHSVSLNPSIGATVDITQYAGGCSFQHSMTATQARDMAEALLTMADRCEEVPA